MDPKDAALLVLMFIVFGAPALGIAARLAIKPVLDAILQLRDSVGTTRNASPDPRITALEEEVRRLHLEVERLAESEEFNRRLLAAGNSPGPADTRK